MMMQSNSMCVFNADCSLSVEVAVNFISLSRISCCTGRSVQNQKTQEDEKRDAKRLSC